MIPGPAASLVRLDGVTASYGGAPVLTDIDLDLRRGEFVGIVGPSGSGKSTLLRVLLGTIDPVSGTLDRAAGTRVGYVPQVEQINWDFPVTVAE